MEGLKSLPYLFLALAVAAIVGGASAVTLGEFGGTITKCFNSSYAYNNAGGCYNISDISSDSDVSGYNNMTAEFNIVYQGLDAETTVAGQLGTVGIIAIMVVIIGLLAGVFVYFQYFR